MTQIKSYERLVSEEAVEAALATVAPYGDGWTDREDERETRRRVRRALQAAAEPMFSKFLAKRRGPSSAQAAAVDALVGCGFGNQIAREVVALVAPILYAGAAKRLLSEGAKQSAQDAAESASAYSDLDPDYIAPMVVAALQAAIRYAQEEGSAEPSSWGITVGGTRFHCRDFGEMSEESRKAVEAVVDAASSLSDEELKVYEKARRSIVESRDQGATQ